MEFSPAQDSEEEVLLERMRKLHAQLDAENSKSVEHKRLIDEIRELAKAYGKLADARQGIGRPDLEP